MFYTPHRRSKTFSLQYISPWAGFVNKVRVQIQRKNKSSVIKKLYRKKLENLLSFLNYYWLIHDLYQTKHLCLKIKIILIIEMKLWFLPVILFSTCGGLATCLELTEVEFLQKRREIFNQVLAKTHVKQPLPFLQMGRAKDTIIMDGAWNTLL